MSWTETFNIVKKYNLCKFFIFFFRLPICGALVPFQVFTLVFESIVCKVSKVCVYKCYRLLYPQVIATGGPLQVVFFAIVVFFGSFYLINLMLAVVAMSYEEEAENTEEVSNRNISK